MGGPTVWSDKCYRLLLIIRTAHIQAAWTGHGLPTFLNFFFRPSRESNVNKPKPAQAFVYPSAGHTNNVASIALPGLGYQPRRGTEGDGDGGQVVHRLGLVRVSTGREVERLENTYVMDELTAEFKLLAASQSAQIPSRTRRCLPRGTTRSSSPAEQTSRGALLNKNTQGGSQGLRQE